VANFSSRLILSLVDQVSAPARRAAQSLRGIVRAVADGNGTRIRALSEASRASIGQLRGDLLEAGAGAYALAAAIREPTRVAREFQSALTDIGQKANLSKREQVELGKAIRALGPNVLQTASEVAKGVDTLAGFGLDPKQALALMTPIGKAAFAYKGSIDDLASATFAAVDNLKVPIGQTSAAISAMAQAGKEGAFELRDMAAYFPSLTAAAQALGQRGTPAVADLAAALQIARKGAGDGAEAATNLANVLQKLRAPATRRSFAKMGVDLEASLDAATRKGMTPLEAIAEVTNRTLKGDLSKLGDLFEDAQVQKGLRPLIQNLDEYRRIRKAAANSGPVLEKDFAERAQNDEAKAKKLQVQAENLKLSLGSALSPDIATAQNGMAALAGSLSGLIERHPVLTRVIVGTTAAMIGFRLATVALSFAKAQTAQVLLDLGSSFGKLKTTMGASATAFRAQWAGNLMAMLVETRTIGGLISLSMRGILAASGIGLLVLAAAWLVQHWKGVVTFFQGFGQGFMAAIAPVRPALEPVIQGVKAVVGWVKKLIGDGGDDWTAWGVKAGTAVGKFVTDTVKVIQSLIDAFKTAFEWAGKLVGISPRKGAGKPGVPPAAPSLKPLNRQGAHPANTQRDPSPDIFGASASGGIFTGVPAAPASPKAGGQAGAFSPTMNFYMQGANAQQVADLVMHRLRSEYRAYADGAYADDAGVFA